MKTILAWFRRDLDWREHVAKGQLVMRRRVKGVWEYREPTAGELADALSWQAIK